MKNSQKFTKFLKISNFVETYWTLSFQQVSEHLRSKNRKYGPKRPNFDHISSIYFYREVVRRPTFKALYLFDTAR